MMCFSSDPSIATPPQRVLAGALAFDDKTRMPTPGPTQRHRDRGGALADFIDEVWVACPACKKAALVRCAQKTGVPRVSCAACGFEKRGWPGRAKLMRLGEPRDPYYGLPLWLRRRFRGEVLWAYNRRHLRVLADYVAAALRETDGHPNHHAMIVRLPRWMKVAKHRAALLKALQKLAEA
jgi:hypothetical protein